MSSERDHSDSKQCPRCGEQVRTGAVVCRFCGFNYADLGQRSTNGFAIASLVLGIVWLAGVGSILAVVFGAVARRQNKRTGQHGDGLALAGMILGAVGIIAIVTAVALIAFDTAPKTEGPLGLDARPQAPQRPSSTSEQPFHFLIRASQGDCWLQVHRGSAAGAILFQGTLERGQTREFFARKLWLTLDRPAALSVELNGKPTQLPTDGPKTLVVTPEGLREGA
jgi:hypothetical protein